MPVDVGLGGYLERFSLRDGTETGRGRGRGSRVALGG